VLEVRAFAPEDAYVLNERLLELSEALVNKLNERAEKRAVTEGERRVASALDRARRARVSMGNFRNSQQIVDPEKQATGVLEISNELTTEQAALEAQLRMYQRAAPRHPAIPMLRSRLASVSAEIASQNARAVGSPTGIASKLGSYEGLLTEQEFATQNLTAASASLEMARVEAQKQQFYLERVVNPNKPDMPVLPKRLIRVLTIFGMLLCVYFIAWMFIVGILEHSPED
jgi:capsular polysaccharide transport system permease protein